MRKFTTVLVALALAGSCARAPAAPAQAFNPTITRDEYGIPHVHGRTDAEAAYGLALAHAEDNFATIQITVLLGRGKLGAHLGEEGARSDFLWHLLGIQRSVEERYESDISPEFRAIVEAYAAGLNAYGAEHPDEVLPGARKVTGRDVIAGSAITVPLFWGFERTLGLVANEDGHPCAAPEATAETIDWGSNAFAVSPRRSDDGHTRLIVNSHQPWAGPVAWYEAGISSDEGWQMHGGLFPGSPFPVLGTNGHIGFAATVNLPDLADIYQLTTDDQHRGQYFIDGEWRRFETRTIWLWVKMGWFTIPVPRTLHFTEHGPAFNTADGWVAVRYAGEGELRALEQFYRMGRAQNYEEWREAMAMRAIPSFNFMYADETGRIGYLYNAIIPRRAEGPDWSGCVPGDTSANIWAMDDRVDAPELVDPSSGWLASTNGAPWYITDESANIGPDAFPDAAPAIETYVTNRGYRAVEILSPLRTISDAQLLEAKFDLTSSERSATMAAITAVLAADSSNDAELAEIQTLLRSWDRRAANDSPAAALAGLIYQPIYNAGRAATDPPDPVDAARAAATRLRQHFGRIDPPLGDVLRLRRGDVDLPLEGAPDVLRALRWADADDGRANADFGDGFMMVIDWAPDGTLSTRVIHQWGASDRPESPHFNDQSEMFARREWRTLAPNQGGAAPPR
ncbi:penicillin acylase family protein [Terricaulis sp.]|uniref:penicillin acylase family protein n=1 Tax=Terricaulis sp. TaxID=2768686 RepID=UPI002AC7D96C|nr:penicillin acylase family protein [Terricaulis sp.]MDZ4692196.1 penicillin acylase family protein [Terricaulis sp.]